MRLLTIDDYAALDEDEHGRFELQEGRLVMSPSPAPDHMLVMARLIVQLDGQLPVGFVAIPDVDVNLELVPRDCPGFSRRPDLVIVPENALKRVRTEGGLLRAGEVEVIVEIVSPGSKRTDYVIKRQEYADAGIGHYWIIDIDLPVSLTDCHLAGGFGYQDVTRTGEFVTTAPFGVRLDLTTLL
jgi:Uma2 family endonuclease